MHQCDRSMPCMQPIHGIKHGAAFLCAVAVPNNRFPILWESIVLLAYKIAARKISADRNNAFSRQRGSNLTPCHPQHSPRTVAGTNPNHKPLLTQTD